MKKLTWLHDLQNFAGVLIGLIMISIGSVIFLNAGAKLYIFGFASSSYFSPEHRCENNFYEPSPFVVPETIQAKTKAQKTPEEIAKCIEKEIIKERKRYTRDKQEDIISGIILIIIGFPLWFFHRQRKEKDVKLEKIS
ncbi:TPA: hypothetical protein EYG96_02625 [Candidatus Gracilibacteria bacterium]|nr:hypothetical protein [Candidatus Peregrinibacteria bacterium]HIQ56910.1 hypothetical protein [Candidatus Gracilibacteria bacterium]HIQ57321.1 hypothetical protein [Candidatus Gracilibacteria bacterium]